MKHRRYAILAALFSTMGSAYAYESLQPINKDPSYLEAKVRSVIHAFGDATMPPPSGKAFWCPRCLPSASPSRSCRPNASSSSTAVST